MSLRHPHPRTVLVLFVVLVIGLAATSVLSFVLPGAKLLAILIGWFVVIGATVGAHMSAGRRSWVRWLGLPAAALLGLGMMMLSEDLALSGAGERVEAVVVDHTLEVREGAHTTYTHTYTLESVDGRPIDEPMVYRGKGGFDGVDEGTEVVVLVDPDGEVPTKPADTVDIGADIAVLIVGLLASAGVFGACAVSAARRTVVRQPR